eukprot:GHVU01196304.1.p1 GENE.GHVU01196304.1~~GHVU01196304.1.p1  ORF type:complete len:353 (+),score=61.44 GHVU01196304.1:67-1125(+)
MATLENDGDVQNKGKKRQLEETLTNGGAEAPETKRHQTEEAEKCENEAASCEKKVDDTKRPAEAGVDIELPTKEAEEETAYSNAFLATLIDHTSLGNKDTEESISNFVKSALEDDKTLPAAFCVYPQFVAQVANAVKNLSLCGSINIATVVNFPEGNDEIEGVVSATKGAIKDGANEIDVVIPYRKLLDAKTPEDRVSAAAIVENLVCQVREACDSEMSSKGDNKVLLKTILETGMLKEESLIKMACEAALKGGSDFLKTSTGKVEVNATPEAVKIMLQCIKEDIDKKCSSKAEDAKDASNEPKCADAKEAKEINANASKSPDSGTKPADAKKVREAETGWLESSRRRQDGW